MSLPSNPLEAIPAEAWLLLGLALAGWGHANYVWRYLTHAHTPRDITQPPEDLSWKSSSQLYRSLALVVALGSAAIFVLSPEAEAFAKSEWFVPSIMGAFGSYALGTVVPGWRKREVQPLLNNSAWTFSRDEQPKRYWASLAWNGVLGLAFVLGSAGVLRDVLTPTCDDPDTTDKTELTEVLATCDRLLARSGAQAEERAELFAARGRVQHRLEKHAEAIRDYSLALALEPRDSDSLYNRGLLLLWSGDAAGSIKDFDASLAIDPDNLDVYRDRGIAHLQLRQDRLAERDFAKIGHDDPYLANILAQRSEFAIARGDYDAAIRLASRALAVEPKNTFALRLRAEAYWKKGDEALSQADDDRVRAIEGHSAG